MWGIDRAIAYTLLSRCWQLLAGFGTVLLISRYLSPVQQGFQYTFAGLISMQVFFELGLTFVVMQFASHEFAHLRWNEQGLLEGDDDAKARLTSLLKLSLKWYAVAAMVLFCLLAPAGLLFFGRSPDTEAAGVWQLPWLMLVVTSSGVLLLSPIFAILEGCGLMARVARFRLYQDMATYPLYWLGLISGLGLVASPAFQLIRLMVGVSWLVKQYHVFLVDQLRFRFSTAAIHWRTEIWPLQWKIAISWMSGYFIYQLYSPVLFAYHGPVEAGKMGMTLTLTMSVGTLALSWINTKMPLFGQLVVHRDYGRLDHLFLRTLGQALLAALFGGGFLFLIVAVVYSRQFALSQRILEPLPFALMTVTAILNVIFASEAVYLRTHKQEPFLWVSVFMAVSNALSAYFLGRAYGALGMAIGALVMMLAGLAISTLIFFRKRRDWHGSE